MDAQTAEELESTRLSVMVQYLTDRELRKLIRINVRKTQDADVYIREEARLYVRAASRELGVRRRAE